MCQHTLSQAAVNGRVLVRPWASVVNFGEYVQAGAYQTKSLQHHNSWDEHHVLQGDKTKCMHTVTR